eukprot:gnl/MRDRNA2_/MRDRNA2_33581_c0_seq1.p1 gnl/MRDRNA2_/MRDRNA2_33581_c0~~gnl/MRDRNA2_/MRDRNA2_33581_c0_seq1.p1  ORF type:complete len:332 (+),score=59.77 gnl/MRDRNA2_/MRDRNA2_33581_c0_seq1:135-998(+)
MFPFIGVGLTKGEELIEPSLAVLEHVYGSNFYKMDATMSSTLLKKDKETMEVALGKDGAKAHTYGELSPSAVLDVFKRLRNHTQLYSGAGRRLYDLGSGTGKFAAIAWLMGFNVTGIEFSKVRFKESCKALEALRVRRTNDYDGLGTLEFLHADFLQYDFSDADVVYTFSLMFSDQMIQGLSQISWALKDGAMVVTAKPFQNPKSGRQLLEKKDRFRPSSDRKEYVFYLQKKNGAPRPCDELDSLMMGIADGCTWKAPMARCTLTEGLIESADGKEHTRTKSQEQEL